MTNRLPAAIIVSECAHLVPPLIAAAGERASRAQRSSTAAGARNLVLTRWKASECDNVAGECVSWIQPTYQRFLPSSAPRSAGWRRSARHGQHSGPSSATLVATPRGQRSRRSTTTSLPKHRACWATRSVTRRTTSPPSWDCTPWSAASRLVSPREVVTAADEVIHVIIETYLGPNRALHEMLAYAQQGNMNVLVVFGEACRSDLAKRA